MEVKNYHFTGKYLSAEKKPFRVNGEYAIDEFDSEGPSGTKFRKGLITFSVVDASTDIEVTRDAKVSLKIIGDIWSIGTFEDGEWIHLASEPFYTILAEVKHHYLSQQH